MLMAICLASCSKDEENKQSGTDIEEATSGTEHVKSKVVAYAKDGSYRGPVIGSVLYDNQPTTLYAGVMDLEELEAMFEDLIPEGAQVIDNGLKKTVILTDKNGVKEGEMYFETAEDPYTPLVIGSVTFSKRGLIDPHVDGINFVFTYMWPGNAPIDDVLLLGQVWRYKKTGDLYVCMREPVAGMPGLLFHVGDMAYVRLADLQFYPKYFPSEASIKAVGNTLLDEPSLWDVMAKASGKGADVLKGSNFFFNKIMPINNMVYSFSLSQRKSSMITAMEKTVSDISKLSMAYKSFASRVYKVSCSNDQYYVTMDCGFASKPSKMRDHLENIFSDLGPELDDFELVE